MQADVYLVSKTFTFYYFFFYLFLKAKNLKENCDLIFLYYQRFAWHNRKTVLEINQKVLIMQQVGYTLLNFKDSLKRIISFCFSKWQMTINGRTTFYDKGKINDNEFKPPWYVSSFNINVVT